MTRPFPVALMMSRQLVLVLVRLNLLVGGLVSAMFVASLLVPHWLFTALGADPSDARLTTAMRLVMIVGLLSVPFAHVLLTRLLAIVESVRVGDPFVAPNGARLQAMAWALLGLEILHVVVGLLVTWVPTPAHPLRIDWEFSLGGWLAVLLLFVLARVFEHGTRMRDDLAGTV
jgi:hypothetical protein